MQRGVMKMIFGDEKQIRLLVLESSGKQNGLSPPPLFFLPSSFYSLHSLFSKIQNPPVICACVRTPLSIFVCTHFTAPLEQWNDNQDKIVQRRARRICFVWEVSVLYTRNVRLTIYHSVLFFCPFSGFANIFEIKCNCFFKLN